MEKEIEPAYYPQFPIDKILSPSFCFRMNIAENIKDLMAEIHAAGRIIEPLIARPSHKLGYVELGPGERRLLAARELNMQTVPVLVSEFSDEEFDRVRLLENLARKDLSDYELARALDYLLRKYSQKYPTQRALAEEFQKSEQWLSQHLKMLELEKLHPGEVLTKLTERQAREILAVPEEKREAIVETVIEEGLPSARKIADIVKPLVECDRCYMARRDTTEYKGEMLCPSCLEEAKRKPVKLAVDIPKRTVEVKEFNPKETWAQRKAVMQPQHSRMEQALLLKLHEQELHPIVDRKFCLRWTIPDFFFPNRNLAVYVDGAVHEGKEERDNLLRNLLANQHGVKVLALTYESFTETEAQRLLAQILSAIENK